MNIYNTNCSLLFSVRNTSVMDFTNLLKLYGIRTITTIVKVVPVPGIPGTRVPCTRCNLLTKLYDALLLQFLLHCMVLINKSATILSAVYCNVCNSAVAKCVT